MNEEEAIKILGGSIIKSDKDFKNDDLQPSSEMGYIRWEKHLEYVTIDGELTIEQLDALSWWLKNKKRG